MTEKTLKHELYKHGSYLHSLKESGSNFINIDDEIKKLEELFQLASKKDTPPFAIGEYYSDGKVIYKVLEIEEYPDTKEVGLAVLALYSGDLYEDTYEIDFPCEDKPATAEQIATFHRAEQFAKHGRKLNEFRVGDRVENDSQKGVVTDIAKDNYLRVKRLFAGGSISFAASVNSCTLIQIAEELQEVEE